MARKAFELYDTFRSKFDLHAQYLSEKRLELEEKGFRCRHAEQKLAQVASEVSKEIGYSLPDELQQEFVVMTIWKQR